MPSDCVPPTAPLSTPKHVHESPVQLDPSRDGIDFINVYSKGRTRLGQLLSNFAHTPFKHPFFGHIASIEGFWYWLSTGCKHDELLHLYGAAAKIHGRKFDRVECPDFQEKVLAAIEYKLTQTPEIVDLMKTTRPLPLEHFYVLGRGPYRIMNKPEYAWLLQPAIKKWEELYKSTHTLVAPGEENVTGL